MIFSRLFFFWRLDLYVEIMYNLSVRYINDLQQERGNKMKDVYEIENQYLAAPEPSELQERLGELFTDVDCDVNSYTEDINKMAGGCDEIETLQKILEKVDELAGYLQDKVDEAEALVAEYENGGYRD